MSKITFAEWKEKIYEKAKEKYSERKEAFLTPSGIPVPCLCSSAYDEETGFPQTYPYTRGIQSTMYRGRLWTMRQYAGFSSARETNERFKFLLNQGQTGLSVAFDLPTQMGYDPEHPLAEGEVGRVGVSICSLRDLEDLFDGIPLGEVSTSMTINATAAVLLAMYIALAKRQGVAPEKLTGTVQNDILKEYVARGAYRFPIEPSMRLVVDIIRYCGENLPRWNTISVSGYHMREAGCDAVQEVAFTLANGLAYVQEAARAGLNPESLGERISFFFNSHNNFLEEVCKFRSARSLWARLMKERFGIQKERALMLRFHTQTAGCTLTYQQQENNVVRVTLQALAAVLGGTQSLHTNSRDEALCLPSEDSVRIALRTQQIIAYESGVADTIDPLGGAPLIENLTSEIERRVLEIIRRIDELGGAIEAIKKGYVQREIQERAYQYQKEIESGSQIVVGVNQFQEEEPPPEPAFHSNPQTREERLADLKRFKKGRSSREVTRCLKRLEEGVRGGEEMMPLILECVEKYATLGEICGVLEEIFGSHQETPFL